MTRWRLISRTLGAGALSCGVVGWWYRPIADPMTDSDGPKRNEYMSPNLLTDFADKSAPIMYDLARKATVFVTVNVFRSFLMYGGQFRIKMDEKYEKFLEKVISREKGEPLITISNHRSLADDTTIFSSILPYWMNIQPKYLRYSLCAQEYCYYHKFPSIVNAYIGLGKTLPIWRGGGVNQKLLLDYARLVAAGEWCHVYPEAGIFRFPTLGGRNNGTENEIGKLKWGVGKLIAHSPRKATVIPIFFSGTEHIIKTDEETGKTASYIPQLGHKVDLRVGDAIDFDDLIEEHEKEYGPVWKYSANMSEDEARVAIAEKASNAAVALTLANETEVKEVKGSSKFGAKVKENFHKYWDSKPSDKILYHKITTRIEAALTKLNEESNKELALAR